MKELEKIEEVVSGVLGNYPDLLGMVSHYNELLGGNVVGIRKARVIIFGDDPERTTIGAKNVKDVLEQKGFSVGELKEEEAGTCFRCSLVPLVKEQSIELLETQEKNVDQIALPMGSDGQLF